MLPPALHAALDREVLLASVLVEFDFASGPARAWSGSPTLVTADGREWAGLGAMGSIAGLDQPVGLSAAKTTFRLAAIPAALGSGLRGHPDQYRGRDARIYLQLWDEDATPIGAPILLRTVWMDVASVSMTLDLVTATLDCEGPLTGRARARAGTFADPDQKARHPGDRFFDFATGLSGRLVPFYQPS